MWGKPHRPHSKALPCIWRRAEDANLNRLSANRFSKPFRLPAGSLCIWSRMVALHPPPRRCFGTQRPYMAIRYISPAKRLTALQVQRTRSALSGSMWLITAHIVPVVRRRAYFWCRQQGLNLQAPGYEPGVLPLNYSDTMAGISASERTIFRAAHMQDAGSVPQEG